MAGANESSTNFPGSDVFKKVLSEFFPVTVEHFEEDLSVGLSRPRSVARGQHGVTRRQYRPGEAPATPLDSSFSRSHAHILPGGRVFLVNRHLAGNRELRLTYAGTSDASLRNAIPCTYRFNSV